MKTLKTLVLLLVVAFHAPVAPGQTPAPLLLSTIPGPAAGQTGSSNFDAPGDGLLFTGILYDNGTIVNSPGTGPGGADESIVYAPLTILGFPSSSPARTADEFSIMDYAWEIDSISFYDLIPNAPTTPSFFSGYYVRIWDGKPGMAGSHVIWGDRTTNRLSSTFWANVYRRGSDSPGNTTLPVFRNTCGTPGLQLSAGTYWVEAQALSNETPYTYSPPVVLQSPASGNSIMFNELSNTWVPLVNNSYPQGMPFIIYGSTVMKSLDAGVSHLLTPQSGIGLSSSEQVSVKVKNSGTQTLTNIPVSYILNGGTPVTGIVPGPVASDAEVVYTFPQTADFSATGSYDLVISTFLPGDEFAGNNALHYSVWNYNSITTMSNNVTASCSGLFFDSGGPGSGYSDNETLVYSFFPATSSPNAKMEFTFTEFDLEFPYDKLYVYDGPTWQYHPLIGEFSGGNVETIGTIRSTDPSGGLTFRFVSDLSESRPGWKSTFHCHIPFDNDLSAVSVTGPVQATVNTPAVFTVKVKNEGNLTQGSYQVKLFLSDNTEIGSTTGISLNYNEEHEYQILGNIQTAGLKDIFARVILSGDQNPANDDSQQIEIQVNPSGTGYVIVGNQNAMDNHLPASYVSLNSLSESIYFPEEIGMEGQITGIGYIYSFRQEVTDAPLKIWMGETDCSDLTGGWIPSTELTEVFNGTVDHVSGVDTLHIDLTTPYEYHGGNLVILVNRPLDYNTYPGNSMGANTFQVTSTPAHPGRSRQYFADLQVINPARPRFGTTLAMIPNTILKFDVSMMSKLNGVVYDPSNQPLEGAVVASAGSHTTTLSTSNGQYAINYIWPGNRMAKASKYPLDSDSASINQVSGAASTHNFYLGVRPLAFVTGSVRPSDAPWNGLDSAVVTITGYDTSYSTYSNSTGFFLLAQVFGNTTYQLHVSHPGYEDYNNQFTLTSGTLNLGSVIMRELTAQPQNVTAVDNITAANVTWSPATLEYTIQYDNDSVYWYLTSFADFRESAIRFTPEGYPCEIKRALLNVNDLAAASGYPNGTFKVKVYDDDGVNNLPGTMLGEVLVTPGTSGWVEVDLSSFNLTVTSGDFYIAHVQTGPYPNYVEIGIDQSFHPENRSYSKPASWSTWALEQYYYHFMIRAVVSGSSDKDQLTVLDPETTSGTQPVTDAMTGYSVYRLNAGEENDSTLWTCLSWNQSQVTYTDNGWNALPWGTYLYAVRTTYTNGVLSSPGFSNILSKDMNITGTIQLVTNTDYVPSDAKVTLTNTDGDTLHVYTASSNLGGMVYFSPFFRGTYRVQVSHHNFLPVDQIMAVTSTTPVQVMLTEKPLVPVFATADDQDTLALVKWYDPSELRDLILDDSLSDASLGGLQGNEVWFGNRFTNTYSAPVISFDVYFERNPFVSDENVTIDIFDANKVVIGTSEPFIPVYDQWMTVRVPDIPVTGDFYGMVHFDQAGGDSHYLGLDLDGPQAAGDPGFYFDGSTWLTLPQFIPGLNSGVFLIRPTLNVGFQGKDDALLSIQTYSLYRLEPGDEGNQSLWVPVNMSVPDTSYSDDTWYTMAPGDYRYAVGSNYSTGISIGYAFTNVLTRETAFPAPTNLSIVQVNGNEAQFSWAPVNGPTLLNYVVYLDDMANPAGTVTDTTFLFTALSYNVVYTAGVKAIYTTGESTTSTIQFTLVPVTINPNTNMKKPEIFPNPVRDVVFIAEARGSQVEIYDITGKLMQSGQLVEPVSRLNLESFPNGIYIVKIMQGKTIHTQKLIISK